MNRPEQAIQRSKYGNRKSVVDGITFDSAKEAIRYGELRLLERAGEITGLELQPSYDCIIGGVKVCTYKADFRYWQKTSPDHVRRVVEDVKGVRTPVYRLKKKLVEALYPGTRIVEV